MGFGGLFFSGLWGFPFVFGLGFRFFPDFLALVLVFLGVAGFGFWWRRGWSGAPLPGVRGRTGRAQVRCCGRGE